MNIKSLTPTSYIMVDGTTGPKSYTAFARKGNVIFSFRPNAITPGEKAGVPKTVYVGIRLRGSFEPEVIAEELNVLNPEPTFMRPSDALSTMTWETDKSKHCASQVSIFLQGSLKDNAAELFPQFEGGEVAAKLADYLASLFKEEELILTPVQIATFIQETFEPGIDAIKSWLEKQKQIQEAMASSVGTVGIQAQILKKLFEQTKPKKIEIQKSDDAVDDLDDENSDE